MVDTARPISRAACVGATLAIPKSHALGGVARCWVALCWVALSALSGCVADDDTGAGGGMAIHFAALAAGGCQSTSNGRNTVPEAVQSLTAVIEVAGAPARIERTTRAAVSKAGQWLIKDIAADTPTNVSIYGCAAGAAIWSGRSEGMTVEDQKATATHLFLAPISALGCTGSEATNAAAGEANHLAIGRSMAAATTLSGGDAVIVGGISSWSASGEGLASRDVDRYDHRAGHFRKGPQLLEARIWHHALALDDHRILVTGGVTNVARIGDTGLPTPLMMPKAPKAARPKQVATEIVNVDAGKSVAATVDVGTGTRLLSSSIRVGDGLLFVGGVDDGGSAVRDATFVTDLAAIADGGAGKTDNGQKLAIARARPALVLLSDGTVLVWGGPGSGKSADLGERRRADGTFAVLAVSGDADLLADASITTVGPAVVSLGVKAGFELLIVSGGATGALSTADVPSYAVVIELAANKAVLRPLKLPASVALSGGVAGFAAPYGEGGALLSGGLISISGGAPCAASDAECIIAEVYRVQADGDFNVSPIVLAAQTIGTLGGRRFGVAVARIPAGVLLAGGQSSVVATGAAPDVFDPTGRIVAAPPLASEAASICK